MPPLRRWMLVTAALLLGSAACSSDDSEYRIKTVFDPCETLVIVPAADTTEEELGAVRDALAMWNEAAGTRLTLERIEGAPQIPVVLDDAALVFFGYYDDEAAVVYANRRLEHHPLEVTLAHELGHAFGLLHVSEERRLSLMNPGQLEYGPLEGDVGALISLWGQCGL